MLICHYSVTFIVMNPISDMMKLVVYHRDNLTSPDIVRHYTVADPGAPP